MNKQAKRATLVVSIIVIALLFIMISGKTGKQSVVGTWSVKGYEYGDKFYGQSDLGELCELKGYSILAWRNATLKLTQSGSAYWTREENGKNLTVTGTYTIGDTFIEICPDNGKNELWDYNGKQIRFKPPVSDITVVLQK